MNTYLIEEKKEKLKELRTNYLEGKLIRSRAKWIHEGEKPSTHFCNFFKNYFDSGMQFVGDQP